MDGLSKKYGLPTAIAMVVGVVIGSGVFFKADDVLALTDGNVLLALIAWGLGAFAMIFGAMCFAEFAGRIERSNGIVDYTEIAYGKRVGYLTGWFNCVIYFSPLSAILAWVSSLYTMILMGSDNPSNSLATWILAVVYMVLIYMMNYMAPIIAGKFQVTTTVIKLIPLALIAVLGVIGGITNGIFVENMRLGVTGINKSGGTLASAVVATAFAYEGWIVAVTVNSEIKDSKKNLPKALVVGTFIVFFIYILYFLGITSSLPAEQILAQGDQAVSTVASNLFGNVGGSILIAFVVVSCLGTLNGLALSNSRIPYSLAIRGQGPAPGFFSKVDEKTNMPRHSAIAAFVLSIIYLILWYASLNNLFGRYIGLDEIPIVMVYGIYIILYIWYMRNFKDLNFFNRYVKPICAILGALVIVVGGIQNPNVGIYLLISLVIILGGLLFYRKDAA
jgi:APA family basic amino acid/polyamine antiporter